MESVKERKKGNEEVRVFREAPENRRKSPNSRTDQTATLFSSVNKQTNN